MAESASELVRTVHSRRRGIVSPPATTTGPLRHGVCLVTPARSSPRPWLRTDAAASRRSVDDSRLGAHRRPSPNATFSGFLATASTTGGRWPTHPAVAHGPVTSALRPCLAPPRLARQSGPRRRSAFAPTGPAASAIRVSIRRVPETPLRASRRGWLDAPTRNRVCVGLHARRGVGAARPCPGCITTGEHGGDRRLDHTRHRRLLLVRRSPRQLME